MRFVEFEEKLKLQ